MKKLLFTLRLVIIFLSLAYYVDAKEIVTVPSHILKSDKVRPDLREDEKETKQATLQKIKSNALLFFIENKGQIIDQNGNHRNDIDYKLDAGGMVMFIGDGQIHYQWNRALNSQPSKTEHYRLDVTLLGANKNARAIAEQPQAYYENYYLPQCNKGTIAHSFQKIIYKEVYPGIDWVVYISHESKVMSCEQSGNGISSLSAGGKLKYDFIVHPGGNPANIRIQYNGATSLALKDGSLTATTPFGSVTENAPYSYYADSKAEVVSCFKLNLNILSYNITGAGREGALVIDPQLQWATYYYQNNVLRATIDGTRSSAVATDKNYNVFMQGQGGNSNMATSGAIRSATDGCSAFVVKFDKDGQRLWGTFYGDYGTENDAFGAICDGKNNIYVCGYFFSNDSNLITTPGAFNRKLGGGYIVKFSPEGSLRWGTFYYGTVKAVACGPSDNVYITGSLDTNNGPATSGCHQSSIGAKHDAFLARFDSTGKRIWSTYYGGSDEDTGKALTCDANENIYMTGCTYSSNNISTAGGYQPSISGAGAKNGFLVKFDSSGVRQWATYYGNADTKISSASCNAAGDVYIAGTTSGTTLISTVGSYQPTLAGYSDCFLAKFNSSGVRQWGTYFGGSLPEDNGTVAISASGKIYLAGITGSSSGIATANGYQTTLGGGYDNYIAEFTPAGNIMWASYYGGSGDEFDSRYTGVLLSDNVGLACSKDASLYLAFTTRSTNNISYGSVYQSAGPSNASGDIAAFLAKFLTDTTTYIILPYNDTLYCAGDSIRVPFDVTEHFKKTNTFTLQLSDATGSFASPVTLATRTDSVAGIMRGRIPPNTAGGTGYKIRISSNLPSSVSYNEAPLIHVKPATLNFSASANSPVCDGDTIRLSGNTTSSSSSVTWQWNGPASYSSITQNSKIVASAAVAGYYKLKATLTSDGCPLTDSVLVATKRLPGKPVASSNTPVCFGNTINLTATDTTAGVSYSWRGVNSFTSALQNPSKSPVTIADRGDYIVTATLNGCSMRDTETVLVYPQIPTPVAGSNSPVCVGSDINLHVAAITGATYNWVGPSYSANVQNPVIPAATLGNSGTYSVTAIVNGCYSSAGATSVTVAQGPSVTAYPSPGDSICTGKTLTLNARVTGAVSAPVYQWLKNGTAIPGATALTYSNSTTINGDAYTLVMTPGNGSVCTTPINSNGMLMTVLQYKAPAVAIAASDSNAWQGVLVNFTAAATDAGVYPKYQWKLNNNDVQGATGNTWGAATLSNADNVCVEVASTYMCPNPATATACHIVKIATGIQNINNDKLHVYPNPVGSELNVEGLPTGTKIQLMDVYGKVVYSNIAIVSKMVINTVNLAPGNYILLLTDANGKRNSYKVVKK